MLIKSIQRRQPRLNLYSLHLLFMTLLDMFVGTKMIATWSVVIGLESHICSYQWTVVCVMSFNAEEPWISSGSVTKLESHICSFLAAGCVSLCRELIVAPAPAVTVG